MTGERQQNQRDLLVAMFAGPNGSGKTTLIEEVKETGLPSIRNCATPALFINPDQVANDLKGEFADQDARDIAAARAAVTMRAEAIAHRMPFAFETVMSHPSRLNEMLLLKAQGYKLLLTFISTDDPEKNVARVTARYETGTTTGHYVAPDKVCERYGRTLALLPRAAEIADAVLVYDNSMDFEKPVLQAALERDHGCMIAPFARNWVLEKLIRPLQQRERELDEMATTVAAMGHQFGDTDELNGTYQGRVLLVTPNYLAQLDKSNRLVLIHDRLMLDTGQTASDGAPSAYTLNEDLTIRYSQAKAPKVERAREFGHRQYLL